MHNGRGAQCRTDGKYLFITTAISDRQLTVICCWVSHFNILSAKCRLDWVQRNPTKPEFGSTQPTKRKDARDLTDLYLWSFTRALPPALKTASLIKCKTLEFERKRGMDSYFNNKWLDRINRIVRIMRPSAEKLLAEGEKKSWLSCRSCLNKNNKNWIQSSEVS